MGTSSTEAIAGFDGSRAFPPEDLKTKPELRAVRNEGDSLALELERKDHLIAALTERLELAANQLDRWNRLSENRDSRRVEPPSNPDDSEGQQSVFTELRDLVQKWSESQSDLILGRLERQVQELHELVASAIPSWEERPTRHESAGSSSPQDQALIETAEVDSGFEDRPATLNTSALFRLQQAGHAPEGGQTTGIKSHEGDQPSEAPAIDIAVDIPAPVPFDTLTMDEAVSAICERDRCILKLRERLAVGGISGDETLPGEIQQRLEELESIWQQKLQQHETALSVERARLARVESELNQRQNRLGKEAGQLPVDRSSVPAAASTDTSDHAHRRRWMKFLGVGRSKADRSGA